MLLEVSFQQSSSSTTEVLAKHGDEVINFGVSLYTKRPFMKDFNVFEEINAYWAHLEEPVQAKIFKIYKDIHDILTSAVLEKDLHNAVAEKVRILLDPSGPHNLESIKNWIDFRSNIQMPLDVKDEYVFNIDKNNSRDKTYTTQDYKELLPLALLLRAFIPIWGEYVFMTRRDIGNDFKEVMAFNLLKKTPVIESEAITKLLSYIEAMVGNDKNSPDFILKGITSEDFAPWLLALICVRRLSISDIRGLEGTNNLVTVIYSYILNKINTPGGSFRDRYKKKEDEDRGGEGESKISTLERYRVKADISVGDKTKLNFSVTDPLRVVRKITQIVTEEDLNVSLQTSSVLLGKVLVDPQLTLARWVIKPAISPRGMAFIPEDTRVRLLGAVEAMLWAHGHHYLALLVTSYISNTDGAMVMTGLDTRKRVPDELMEELERIYPYKRELRNRIGTVEVRNHVLESVDLLVNDISSYSWRTTASEDKVLQVMGSNTRNLPIKSDIKTDLIKLLIELGSRQWF